MNNQRKLLMLLISAVMILAFQNCGQQGAVGVESGPSLAKSTSDTMIVNPNGENNDGTEENAPVGNDNVVVSDDGKKCDDKDGHKDHQDKEHHQSGDHADKEKSAGSCGHIQIADFLLKVKSVHANSADTDAIELDETDAVVSMNKLHITIRAKKDVAKLKQIFMVLKDQGNKVLDFENLAHDLKTPSGQTAGLKVHLDSEISLKAGEIYSLQLSIDPAKQIISNPQKCLFRPVIKSARIVVALVDTIAM